MEEMAVPREHHGNPRGVRSGDHFLVPDGTAGLDAGGGPGVNGYLEAVRKRDHGVGSHHAALQVQAGLGTARAEAVGVLGEQFIDLQAHPGEALAELLRQRPVGGRAAPLQLAGGGQQAGAAAQTGQLLVLRSRGQPGRRR